jgi:hypothetical protein
MTGNPWGHDSDDPLAYLNAIEAIWLAADSTRPRCPHCRVEERMLPMTGNGWGLDVFHEVGCPDNPDDEPQPTPPVTPDDDRRRRRRGRRRPVGGLDVAGWSPTPPTRLQAAHGTLEASRGWHGGKGGERRDEAGPPSLPDETYTQPRAESVAPHRLREGGWP